MLGGVIDTGGMSYPQYVLPVVVIQVIFLGALTTVDRAAQDERTDFGDRIRTLSNFRGDTADGAHVVLPHSRHPRPACRDCCGVRFRVPTVRRVHLYGGFRRPCTHVDAGTIARRRCSRDSFRGLARWARALRRGHSDALDSANAAGHAVHRDGAGGLVSRLAASIRALSACFTGDSNPAWVHHRPCRGRQSDDQCGVVSWAAGGVRCTRGAGSRGGRDERRPQRRGAHLPPRAWYSPAAYSPAGGASRG